ncbi:MAG: VanZ family protein [Candidatus Aureabacteria bacterium]|nr:VanZ family protein [Candidatus Auribacterota bacterium]
MILDNSQKKKYFAAVILYTLFIFIFTIFARDISNAFRKAGFLTITIYSGFAISTVFIILYIKKNPHFFNVRSAAGLLFLTFLLASLLKTTETIEEKFHFLEFGILALIVRKSASWNFPVKLQYTTAIIVTSLIGVLDELFQLILPSRFFDLRDIALNMISGIIAILGFEIIHNRLKIRIFKKRD